jgi:glycosyltransferase involved in cell wall biosynthesis
MRNFINEHAVLWFHRHVWPRLKAKTPGLRICIAGNAPSPRILDLSRNERDITVPGYVDDFRPLVGAASVFVSPLQIGTGIKNRVLQAMAMEKAIVASPLSVEGISIEHGKEVLVAADATEFTRAILLLLGDPPLREALGRRARSLVEQHHSPTGTCTRFLKIVEDCVNDKRARGQNAH